MLTDELFISIEAIELDFFLIWVWAFSFFVVVDVGDIIFMIELMKCAATLNISIFVRQWKKIRENILKC